MRRLTSSLLGILALVFFCGCSPQDEKLEGNTDNQIVADPLNQALPKYPSRYWQVELKLVMESLPPAEKDLLIKFMSRHIKTSLTSNQIPVADGVTIKQAIVVQSIIDAEMEQQEIELSALKELIKKQADEIVFLKDVALRSNKEATYSVNNNRQQVIRETVEINTYNKAMQQALERYGVPELEAQLQIAMQKDRADPGWLEHQTDSRETAAIRMRLVTARHFAEQSVPLPASGN